uniref:Uncharacterized protein n=1 Tax=Dunaliella tertiolecta TaxID=3047 RepID=A0A7S3VHP6_DUNTE
MFSSHVPSNLQAVCFGVSMTKACAHDMRFMLYIVLCHRLGALARDSDMRASKLSRALEECEAHRRRFEDLEGCHSSVKQRLEAARASDDLFNRTSQRQQSLQENPPASPARRGEKIRYIPPTGFM